jgi:hypothetical protein
MTGGVDVKQRSGRPLALSKGAAEMALELLVEEGTQGAAHAARLLKAKGVIDKVVSRSTLTRAARKAAQLQGVKLWVKRGKPQKGMTKATKEKRLKFALANKNKTWANVLFTDRKKFHFTYPGSKVRPVRWVKGTHDAPAEEVFQPNHPQCLNVYCGISKYGMTTVHIVAGSSKHVTRYQNKGGKQAKNITSMEYQDVLKKTLLPEGRRLFTAQGISSWYLQQDNDPTHACARHVVQAWNAHHASSVQLLQGWPPNSPDLNIIENVWARVQAEVNKEGCHTFEEFKKMVETKLAAVPNKMIVSLYKSLPKRMAQVIEYGGGPTKY